jgi:hypothetical protein
MKIKITTDLSLLTQAMQRCPVLLVDNIKDALEISTRDIQERARQFHGYITRSGSLDKSIEARVNYYALNGAVGINTSAAKYGLAIHDGSKPHYIRPVKKKVLRWVVGDGAGFAFAKFAKHPGTKADKFINNAAQAEKSRIKERFNLCVTNALKGAFG